MINFILEVKSYLYIVKNFYIVNHLQLLDLESIDFYHFHI